MQADATTASDVTVRLASAAEARERDNARSPGPPVMYLLAATQAMRGPDPLRDAVVVPGRRAERVSGHGNMVPKSRGSKSAAKGSAWYPSPGAGRKVRAEDVAAARLARENRERQERALALLSDPVERINVLIDGIDSGTSDEKLAQYRTNAAKALSTNLDAYLAKPKAVVRRKPFVPAEWLIAERECARYVAALVNPDRARKDADADYWDDPANWPEA